jgi:hypothetical protein
MSHNLEQHSHSSRVCTRRKLDIGLRRSTSFSFRGSPSMMGGQRVVSRQGCSTYPPFFQRYGYKSTKMIAGIVKTRTPSQVRTHAQKFLLKLVRRGCSVVAGGEAWHLNISGPRRSLDFQFLLCCLFCVCVSSPFPAFSP